MARSWVEGTRGGEDFVDVRCEHCGELHHVPRDIFDARAESVDLNCTKCGKKFPVLNPKLATFRLDPTDKKIQPLSMNVSPEGRELSLPKRQEISIRVLEGEERGTVYPVSKPRITIGRTNADILVEDGAASRLHCALEVGTDGMVLRDLGSTNGTWVEGKPILAVKLQAGAHFKIGTHVFQLVITPKNE